MTQSDQSAKPGQIPTGYAVIFMVLATLVAIAYVSSNSGSFGQQVHDELQAAQQAGHREGVATINRFAAGRTRLVLTSKELDDTINKKIEQEGPINKYPGRHDLNRAWEQGYREGIQERYRELQAAR